MDKDTQHHYKSTQLSRRTVVYGIVRHFSNIIFITDKRHKNISDFKISSRIEIFLLDDWVTKHEINESVISLIHMIATIFENYRSWHDRYVYNLLCFLDTISWSMKFFKIWIFFIYNLMSLRTILVFNAIVTMLIKYRKASFEYF